MKPLQSPSTVRDSSVISSVTSAASWRETAPIGEDEEEGGINVFVKRSALNNSAHSRTPESVRLLGLSSAVKAGRWDPSWTVLAGAQWRGRKKNEEVAFGNSVPRERLRAVSRDCSRSDEGSPYYLMCRPRDPTQDWEPYKRPRSVCEERSRSDSHLTRCYTDRESCKALTVNASITTWFNVEKLSSERWNFRPNGPELTSRRQNICVKPYKIPNPTVAQWCM